jgi:hypothetical protein
MLNPFSTINRLTKQFEGGACKCGAYWTAGQYGPFHLEHVSTEGGEDTAEKDVSGFNFHVGGNSGPSSEAPNIKRTFLLSHSEHPEEKPRKVIQLQCVAWPDFDVPEDPRLLLGLVKEVDKAAVDVPDEKDDQSRKAPVLVHCKHSLSELYLPDFKPLIAVLCCRLGWCRSYRQLYGGRLDLGWLAPRAPTTASQDPRVCFKYEGSQGRCTWRRRRGRQTSVLGLVSRQWRIAVGVLPVEFESPSTGFESLVQLGFSQQGKRRSGQVS